MLKIENVSKAYGETCVFDSICLNIDSKSIVALTGKNGIGKTTLLNILSGIIKFSGEIVIEGISQQYNYEEYMKLVSYIPNTPFLYDYLTFEETIQMLVSGSRNISHNFELAEKLIKGFNLDEHRNVLCKNLSLGTRQKLACIVAFFDFPKVILFDEPFVNFDNDSVHFSINFMKEYIKNNNAIIIYSTHTHSNSDYLREVTSHEIEIISKTRINVNEK